MQIAPEVHQLEDMALAAQVPMTRALTEAKVSLSTWWRWRKKGSAPSTETLRKVREAIASIAERRAA